MTSILSLCLLNGWLFLILREYYGGTWYQVRGAIDRRQNGGNRRSRMNQSFLAGRSGRRTIQSSRKHVETSFHVHSTAPLVLKMMTHW